MGMYLSVPKTDKVSEDGENDRLRFGASAMQGWRETMEDAHAALPDLDDSTSFFGVYDGHGGKAVAKFCAKYLHEEVLKQEAYLTGDLVTSLSKAFLRMDEMMRGQRGWRELAVLGDKISVPTPESAEAQSSALNDQLDQWSIEDGPHSNFDGPNSGSTACVAIIRDNLLVVANAGDSRCVLSRKGQAYPLSKDHKPDLAMERERIITSGGFVHAGRVNGSLNLSRAIGDVELKRNKELPVEQQSVTAIPDVTSVEMCEDDEFLVIACDGIWDCMLSQQLVDYVRERLKHENKLSAVCEQVFERCLAPATGIEGCDNMTMILVDFKKHDSTASTETNPSSSAPSTEKVFTGNNPTSSSPSTEKAPTDKSSAGNKPEKASSGDKILSSEPLPEKDKPLSSDSSLEKASTGNKSDALTEKDEPLSSDSSPEKASTGNKSDASTEKGKPLLSDSLHEKASTGDKSDASTEKD